MEIVELRVHGVHGTSPASMLGVANSDVAQVAGDGLTGVYRSSAALPYRDLEDTDVSVEAYSWGALTSGVAGVFGWVKRALWLLLLPFALANLAYWGRLRMAEDSSVARWGARATRVGAILLTVFMVLTPCLVVIDLIAWQCYRGGSPGCAALPGLLDFMARLNATQRLAVGSVMPLAVVGLLWFLSRQSLIRYEEVTAKSGTASTGGVLRHPKMWNGKDRTLQLQRVHLTVALAVVVSFTGIHVLRISDDKPPLFAVTLALTVLVTICAFGWATVIHPDDIDYFHDSTSPIVAMRRRMVAEPVRSWLRESLPEQLLRAMLLITVAHLVGLLTVPTSLDDSGDFYGHNLWFISVFVLLTAVHLSIFTGGRMRPWVALVVVLLVFVLAGFAIAANLGRLPESTASWVVGATAIALLWAALLRWHYKQGEEHPHVAWNGAGASVMLAAAAWVGLLFTTGVVTVTANFLNGDGHGVDDLVSRSSPAARQAAEAYPSASTASTDFTAAGDVTAKHAIVRVSPDGVVVVKGTVESESLYQPSKETTGPQKDLARALDSTRVRAAQVTLPSPSLAIEDSCVRGPDDTSLDCSAESADFVPAGTMPLDSPVLSVEADQGRITLAVTKPPQMPLVVPQVLIWTPVLQLLWLVAVAAFVAVALTRFRRSGKAIEDLVELDEQIPERDRNASKHARRTAALAHRAERLLDGIGALTAIIAIALISLSASGKPPWDVWPWTRNIATLAMYVVAGLSLALIYLASQLRRSDTARKGVGVLWDLTTFWPRAAHPLSPPCYAERVVPELRTRVNWALRDPEAPADEDPRRHNLIVLSGHSQGSVILAAVVSRLSRRDLARVRIITYGSQIRALYGRVFPRALGPEEIGYVPTPGPTLLADAFPDAPTPGHPMPPYDVPGADPALSDDEWAALPLFGRVYTAGGEWANLFRRSDPLGFRVFSDADSPPDHYVPEVPHRVLGDPGPTVLGHGRYQHSLVYRAKLHQWTGEPFVGEPLGTKDLPPIPGG